MVKKNITFKSILNNSKKSKDKKKKCKNIITEIKKKKKSKSNDSDIEKINNQMELLQVDNNIIINKLNEKVNNLSIQPLKGYMAIIPVLLGIKKENDKSYSSITHTSNITSIILYRNRKIKINKNEDIGKNDVKKYINHIDDNNIENIHIHELDSGLILKIVKLKNYINKIKDVITNNEDLYTWVNYIDIYKILDYNYKINLYENIYCLHRNNTYNILGYKIYISDEKDKFIYLEDIYKQLILLSN